MRLAEMSSSQEEITLVATTRFDDIELFSRRFASVEAAAAFLRDHPEDEVMSYAIEGMEEPQE
jgi:hypothetical protein